MATKYNINNNKRYAPTGYEGDSNTDYIIPSCGVEDLDLSIFDLFDKQIPIYYDLHGEWFFLNFNKWSFRSSLYFFPFQIWEIVLSSIFPTFKFDL